MAKTFLNEMKDSIETGDIVRYMPDEPDGWVGVVSEIRNDESTKEHGHSGDVYIIQDLLSTARVATKKELLYKYPTHI